MMMDTVESNKFKQEMLESCKTAFPGIGSESHEYSLKMLNESASRLLQSQTDLTRELGFPEPDNIISRAKAAFYCRESVMADESENREERQIVKLTRQAEDRIASSILSRDKGWIPVLPLNQFDTSKSYRPGMIRQPESLPEAVVKGVVDMLHRHKNVETKVDQFLPQFGPGSYPNYAVSQQGTYGPYIFARIKN